MEWIFDLVNTLLETVFGLVNMVAGTLFGFLGIDWEDIEPPVL